MEKLRSVGVDRACALYAIDGAEPSGVRRYVASTPSSRSICNDPSIVGLDYTGRLQRACTDVLRGLSDAGDLPLSEAQTTVLHILRGGLNFGLREALGGANGWNRHGSAFISAQRARQSDNPEDWHITENAYSKVELPEVCSIVFGDVVATGTSLQFALRRLLDIAGDQGTQIRSILFFTFGSIRAEAILTEAHATCQSMFPAYEGASVVYLEGRFRVAQADVGPRVRISGTDLLRTGALLAPEFLESQFDDPAYPLERCAIYDAGSRAFCLPEYSADVRDYWQEMLDWARSGASYQDLLADRMPEMSGERFGLVDALALCERQLARVSVV